MCRGVIYVTKIKEKLNHCKVNMVTLFFNGIMRHVFTKMEFLTHATYQ